MSDNTKKGTATGGAVIPEIHVDPDACIACTTCTVFCPVADVTGEFLGPRMIGPAYERFRLGGISEDVSLSWCTNCKNCEISCPQGVPVAAINMVARARQCATSHPHLLRDWIVSHSELLAKCIAPVPAPVKNWAMRNGIVRGVLDAVGVSRKSTMPSYAPKRFRRMLASLKQPSTGRRVVLFPGCYIDLYDPQTGLDLVWALNRAGYEVESPDGFSCCGVPMVASGFMKDARRQAEKNFAVLADCAARGVPVLVSCPSCELMMREEIPRFFPDVVEKATASLPAQDSSGRKGPLVRDAQEFLLELVGTGELQLGITGTLSSPLLYHAPCHLRALGIGLPGLELLRAAGVRVPQANAGCCGISGSYGFKKEKHEVSMKVGERLFRTIARHGAGHVLTECGTCKLQIAQGAHVPCMHPVSLLRRLVEGGYV